MRVLFPATFIVHCRQHCTNCSSSGSRSISAQIIVNEFEGKLALSSTYLTSPPPHFYCFPSLDPPPLPTHYLLFLLLLLLIFPLFSLLDPPILLLLHLHIIDPTSTGPTSNLHRPNIDPTSAFRFNTVLLDGKWL